MKIAVIGAGGHARSLINLLELTGYEIVGVYDDNFQENQQELICGYELKGKLTDIQEDLKRVLAIGNNQIRAMKFEQFQQDLLQDNLIHPRASIASRVKMQNANQIFAQVVLNSEVEIGANNIFNTSASIEHESVIGSHTHIAVGAVLCGRVKVGDYCLVGANAVINPNITICDRVTIGSGSVVIENISEPGTYAGNPVRKIK